MHTFVKLLFTALLLSLFLNSWTVDAAPSRRGRKHGHGGTRVFGGSTHRLRQFRNKKYKRTANSGTVALAKTYKKFNVLLPDELANAIAGIVVRLNNKTTATGNGTTAAGNGTIAAGNGTAVGVDLGEYSCFLSFLLGSKLTHLIGTVDAIPEAFDREYLCPVQIGTPPQTVNLNIDTGSADLWVNTHETPENQQSGQLEYNPTLSSTAFLMKNATWDITYGDGSTSSGSVYVDKVSLGGVTVTSQAIESAQTVSSAFQADAASSGLLGLSFSVLNTVQPVRQKTFFDNAMDDLESPLFTANLKKQEEGNYNFGYINQSEYTGEIKYTDVDNVRGFWGFNPSGYQVGGHAFNSSSWFAIADTGTSLLLLPRDMVDIYWAAVDGAIYDTSQGGYTYPCESSLPDFTFGVGDYRGVIPGNFMNYAQISITTCFGGIQSSAGIGFSIFGDVALKAQFVVFDGGEERLGWANKDLS